ncbi:hypothetical protein AAZX31_15G081000 [Glycine max]
MRKKETQMTEVEARSRVVNTKRTILSPFTKEYRVFATLSGIRQFFSKGLLTRTLSFSLKYLTFNSVKTNFDAYL